jgi:hypothetical protein
MLFDTIDAARPSAATPRRPIRARRTRRPRWGRRSVGAVIVLAALGTFAAVVPLPDSASRWLLLASRDWVLSDYRREPTDGPVMTAARRLLATFAEYQLAAMFRRHHPLHAGLDEPHRILARLVALRRMLLNQVEVPHAAGTGWCDQLNGVAAMVLAAELGPTELIGVTDPVTGDGHTIGRVWSARQQRWLYFDLWSDDLVVFGAEADGGVRMLATARFRSEHASDAATASLLHRWWAAGPTGTAFNRFAATFGGYLWWKTRAAMSRRTLPAQRTPAGAPEDAAPEATLLRVGSLRGHGASLFIRARVAQLAGEAQSARALYDSAAHDPAIVASPALEQAAQLFVRRLASPDLLDDTTSGMRGAAAQPQRRRANRPG